MEDKSELEILLNLLPISEIRNIIYERGLSAKNIHKEKLINTLLKKDWTEEQIEDLKKHYNLLKEEEKPYGFFIIKIKSIDLNSFINNISKKLAEFDDNGNLINDGYEYNESNNKLIGKYYRKIIKPDISLKGEIREVTNTYSAGFELNFDNKLLFISSDTFYPIAVSLKKDLEKMGLFLDHIGHQTLLKDDAKQKIEDFVNKLKEKLGE